MLLTRITVTALKTDLPGNRNNAAQETGDFILLCDQWFDLRNSDMPHLKHTQDISYILTHCLNQDIIENLFSLYGIRGGLNDLPSPLDALYRLRMIV
ncbi:hypothetical protein PR048_008935 [Dryococelus australis]|uniref:Uncharacterized protein n=1 Tax=Dryococelus australis TaxID=614101 RepID=A0ABQ9HYI1_9NEOP|nr:hypothetical protein PR048_008935 [Dryococelus australis]